MRIPRAWQKQLVKVRQRKPRVFTKVESFTTFARAHGNVIAFHSFINPSYNSKRR
jgi:hypothetical protein